MSLLNNLDTKTVNLAMPVIKGMVKCIVSSCQEVADDKGRERVEIELKLQEPATTIDGNDVNPGMIVWDRINTTPPTDPEKARKAAEIVSRKMAQFQMAVLGITDQAQLPALLPLEQYVGKEVTAVLDARADRQDPSKQWQDVKRYIAAK